MIKKFNIGLLVMFGLGYSKFMPGTIASFVTLLIYNFLFILQINIFFLLILFLVVLIYSTFIIDKLSNNFSSIDAKEIVIDEFIGQSIPILSIYFMIEPNNLIEFILLTLISFVIFRIFDIFKPFPINLVDKKIKNGFGVIFDDVLAGVITSIIILSFIYFIPNGQ
jgi:phosphatidylglycerophosphatase A